MIFCPATLLYLLISISNSSVGSLGFSAYTIRLLTNYSLLVLFQFNAFYLFFWLYAPGLDSSPVLKCWMDTFALSCTWASFFPFCLSPGPYLYLFSSFTVLYTLRLRTFTPESGPMLVVWDPALCGDTGNVAGAIPSSPLPAVRPSASFIFLGV